MHENLSFLELYSPTTNTNKHSLQTRTNIHYKHIRSLQTQTFTSYKNTGVVKIHLWTYSKATILHKLALETIEHFEEKEDYV